MFKKNNLDKLSKRLKFSSGALKPLLHNRGVLFALAAVAVTNLFIMLHTGDFRSTAIFVLVGIVTSFFSKNMVVVLTIAIALTSVVKLGSAASFAEGMEDEEEEQEEEEQEGMEDEEEEQEGMNYGREGMEDGEEDEDEEGMANEQSNSMGPGDYVSELAADSNELIELQKKIIGQFNEISPYLNKAEGLVEKMDATASSLSNNSDIKSYLEKMKSSYTN